MFPGIRNAFRAWYASPAYERSRGSYSSIAAPLLTIIALVLLVLREWVGFAFVGSAAALNIVSWLKARQAREGVRRRP